uniref:Cell division cycle protein 27 homolog n=1 Tax=Parascaris univalens TaxID=6257 RepID=A0A915BQ60_PARUN
MQQSTSHSAAFLSPARNSIEEMIYCYLEFFALDDAMLLAELYNSQVKNESSLYLLAQCLMRAGRTDACYKLLSTSGQTTPQLRFLFARCCYELNKLEDAELVLRAKNEAQLSSLFEGNAVEPFARALLARIFIESGRPEEAKCENRRAIEENVFSWSAIKAQCDWGAAADIDEIYEQIVWKTNVKKSGVKAKSATPESSSRQTSPDKSVKSEEKKTPVVNGPEQKISCFAPKKRTHVSSTRKLVHTPRHLSEAGGVETRRSARLFPSSQDSENYSTVVAVRELRGTSRSLQSTISGGTSSRTAHDKQLRSMNRINEMEVNNVAIKVRRPSPVSTPSLHKLIESPDSDSSTKATSPVSRRTRSGSQSAASPLSDKNAQFKDDMDTSTGSAVSASQSSDEVNARTVSVFSDGDCCLETDRCSSCARSLKPFKVASVRTNRSGWSEDFMNLLECICQVALMQSCLSRYQTMKVVERLITMPAICAETPIVREVAARAYLERLEYNKAKELLQLLHQEFPYRVAGMEVLSTVLWHTQDARELSLLALELTTTERLSAEAWCVAGNCFSVQKQHDTAIECFERAISLSPRFAYAYSLLGHELLDTDQLDKATSAFRRALVLCNIDYRAYFGLGLIYFKRERLSLARSYLNRAVRINPYNSVVLCQLSVIEQALHNDGPAMELLQRALKITPENAACRFYRARLLYEKHEYERCKDELNELKLYAHDEAQVFFLLGRVYKKLGNTQMALLNFSWAAEMDPRGEQSHNSLAEGPYDDEGCSD